MSARTDRARAVGLWLRDTGLGAAGYVLVLVVAVAGWSASFVGLHEFAVTHMGLDSGPAWLVPVTFDGAALGLTMSVARAAMHGRGAATWRVLVVAFTALSAWINYTHIDDSNGRWVAALLPISAVTVFESLMSEARKAYDRRERQGRARPRIHPLRWVVDTPGTWAIVRAYVLDLPLPERYAAGQTGSTPAPEPDRPAADPIDSAPVDPPRDGSVESETATGSGPVEPSPNPSRSGADLPASRPRTRRPDRGRRVPRSARGTAPRRSIEEARADALARVESGEIDPTTVSAEELRRVLRIGPDRARLLRDELRAGPAGPVEPDGVDPAGDEGDDTDGREAA